MLFQSTTAYVVDSDTILINASDLQLNFLDLKDAGLLPIWDGKSSHLSTANSSHKEQVLRLS